MVEVRCVLPETVARTRYEQRMPVRRSGHLQAQRPQAELWSPELRRPTGLGPVIDVDTTRPLDAEAVVRRITAVVTNRP